MKIFRTITIVILTVFQSGCDSDKTTEEVEVSRVDFDQLSEDSYEYLQGKQDEAAEKFGIGEYERFDWDQETRQLVWSDGGVPKVVADIQFVGSVSTKSDTWLWSWANSSVLEPLSKEMLKVREFGSTHDLEKLTERKWSADEVDGWEMTAIAAYLLKAHGAYRSSDENGFTYMVFTDLRFAD